MRTCPHCGQPASDEVMLCASCGNALPPPLPATSGDPQTIGRPPVSSDSPPTLSPPTLVQPTYVHPTYVQPTQQISQAPVVISVPSGTPPPAGKRGSGVLIGMLLGFAVVAALVVIAVRVLDKRAENDALTENASVTSVAATTTVQAATGLSATVPTTIEPTTIASTIPETTVVTTVAPVPTVLPIAGPGMPLVLRDPMSGGESYADVSGSFALAQQLADALAADDWNRVRQLEPAKAGFTDAQFNGYLGLDRASLILVDARPDGDGYRNLVVSVANEKDGARTTLFCLEWSASVVTGFVVQHTGVVGKLTTLDGLVSSEAVLNDPTLLDLVFRKCVWS